MSKINFTIFLYKENLNKKSENKKGNALKNKLKIVEMSFEVTTLPLY
jgi:hypothetical protein